jgi:hypothetical protein
MTGTDQRYTPLTYIRQRRILQYGFYRDTDLFEAGDRDRHSSHLLLARLRISNPNVDDVPKNVQVNLTSAQVKRLAKLVEAFK